MENWTNLEAVILRFLEAHQGRDFAISRARLVEKINDGCAPPDQISERTIRQTIKHLTTQHGFAIGSCHAGYFMAITAQEIEGVCKYYDSYVKSAAFVSSRLKKIEMRDYFGQLSLRFSSAVNADATK